MVATTIADDQNDISLPIDGLGFKRNIVNAIAGPEGWFTQKLRSSDGPLISDFVTHERGFSYSNYGIHIGQDDRLTFLGNSTQVIEGYFVDCRGGSQTHRLLVHVAFAPSFDRRLIIPRGVAHTFDNLEGIVTRDEPLWYSDEDNSDWNIDNDLIAIPREIELTSFPIVRGNRHFLPDSAHRYLSRLSQSLLKNPRSYLTRHLINIGGTDQYVMFEPTSWSVADSEVAAKVDVETPTGIQFIRARYAHTGPRSWTLVPTTASCVADVLRLNAHAVNGTRNAFVHARTRKLYTFMSAQGAEITLKSIDCRHDSSTFGERSKIVFKCDPRVVLVIDNGIGYSLTSEVSIIVRCEHEIFVDENEPRNDLPMFGQDAMLVSAEISSRGISVPKIRCPDDIIYLIAKHETLSRSAGA